jgi:hypothetical protein
MVNYFVKNMPKGCRVKARSVDFFKKQAGYRFCPIQNLDCCVSALKNPSILGGLVFKMKKLPLAYAA